MIRVLDNATIDKIAAGEVVEKPASVAKELVENAIDAGATSITVEIKDGGIAMLRVSDNGSGIMPEQVGTAFLRHATSKIETAEDLEQIMTLGFRGEALASIAAVAMVELVTKVRDNLTGIRYVIEGGREITKEEVGAPDGTTIIVRNLFFNVPARKKFLKKPQTEGAYIADLMEHMALSHPEISFRFIQNNQVRFSTAGNGNLKEVIYRIYGKDLSDNVKETEFFDKDLGIRVKGYIGVPGVNRANRNYEIFFINNRYVKSDLLSKAVEEGYKEYLMQHKFPICILHFGFEAGLVDVNVHPTKMEVRITNGQDVYDFVAEGVHTVLAGNEMIPQVAPGKAEPEKKETVTKHDLPELFELNRMAQERINAKPEHDKFKVKEPTVLYKPVKNVDEPAVQDKLPKNEEEQLSLFEEKIISRDAMKEYVIVGQIFKTYWLVTYRDKLLIIDQHAAHEKVKYERFIKQLDNNTMASQRLNPPIVVSLQRTEADILEEHKAHFEELGFVIEHFGGNEYALRAVPMELYGEAPRELLLDMLEDIRNEKLSKHSDSVRNRIATMACKAAVKGNQKMSVSEMEQLLGELMGLDNPYHCPHGRPTIITMSQSELEKKFKRIL